MQAEPGPLRVMLVDDHALVRAAVRQAISSPGIEVVAEAATGHRALEQAIGIRPDVLLLDIGLPDVNGLDLLRELCDRLDGTQIVVLTVSSSARDIRDAVRAGAAGYLTKDLDPPALRRAVEGIAHGELAMPRTIAAEAIRLLREDVSPDRERSTERLTRRERVVLRLIADGLKDREIAASLGVSRRTAEAHVGSILHKLGVPNRVCAARRYRES